jgi:hypothetical protein
MKIFQELAGKRQIRFTALLGERITIGALWPGTSSVRLVHRRVARCWAVGLSTSGGMQALTRGGAGGRETRASVNTSGSRSHADETAGEIAELRIRND